MKSSKQEIKHKGPKLLEQFNKNFLKSERPPTVLITKQLWLAYQDQENPQETLNEPQSVQFILHFLRYTRLSSLIKEQENKNSKLFPKDKKIDYWEEFAIVFFHELDPKAEGKMDFEMFSKVLNTDWTDFLKNSITQGQEHRVLTLRLREQLKKKNAEASTSGSKKKKKKKISKFDDIETQEIDKIWDEHIEEEERDLKIEQEASTSIALSSDHISNLRSIQIKEVSEILEIKPHIAETLLDRVKWNQDKLMTEYFNNQETFLKSVGIDINTVLPSQEKRKKKKSKKKDEEEQKEDEEVTCTICFDDCPPENTTCLEECGHKFCNDCWLDMLEMQINDGHTFDILCMHKGCNQLVPPTVVEKLVSPETRLKYMRFLSKTFVDHAKHIRWCPARGCENAITEAVTEGRIRVATCTCGNRICWECEKDAHPPIACKLLEKFEDTAKQDEKNLGYMIENNLDAQTLKWMQENTKQCPFCNVVVQKHNGCYCMTCKQCNQSWCWLCADPWLPTHQNHFKCTKYNAGGSQLTNKPRHKDRDTFKNRIQLERLAHYCRLYQEQTKALQLEANSEIKEQDEKKIIALKTEFESLDTSFIANGRLQLKKCRQTLKYSYVHTYYLKSRSTSLKVVEYLQDSLEISIERLAQALDRPMEQIDPPEIRKLTKISCQALNSLLQQVLADSEKVDLLLKPKEKGKGNKGGKTARGVKEDKGGKAKENDPKGLTNAAVAVVDNPVAV